MHRGETTRLFNACLTVLTTVYTRRGMTQSVIYINGGSNVRRSSAMIVKTRGEKSTKRESSDEKARSR